MIKYVLVLIVGLVTVISRFEGYPTPSDIDKEKGYCESEFGRIENGESIYDDTLCEKITCRHFSIKKEECSQLHGGRKCSAMLLVERYGNFPKCCPECISLEY